MEHRRAWIDPDVLPDRTANDRHLRLPERVAHYVGDVLRMQPGDALELFDGRGRVLDCRIQRVTDEGVRVAILDDGESHRNESPCRLTICQAIPKGERWRWILEKCTELGVHRIVPLETHHGVVQIPEDKLPRKLERWRRITGSAARQCERTRTPVLEAPREVGTVDPLGADGLEIAVHARRDGPPLQEVLKETTPPLERVRLWIGPEGGFDDDEIARIQEAGATVAHLGPRILRTETAAVVAATIVQNTVGDLARRRES